ncbi:MAG: class I SAM-dependent methyltransferase [Gemmatimonadales bacterium]|nr:class I SAM-dependent methyltransferase [Gemmatimonadales bacterium]
MNESEFEAHARVEDRHWWFVGRRRIISALVREAASGTRLPVADIGCGTGGNAAALHALGHDVIGLDPSVVAIGLARERFPTVSFVNTADPGAARAHLAGGGVAILADVLEHVQNDHELLRQVIDVIPSGGHVLITVPADPALWSPHDVAFGHHRRYDVATLSALWSGAPVETRLLSHFNARLRPVIAAVRRVRRDAAPRPGGDLRRPFRGLNSALAHLLAGERHALVGAIDTGRMPHRRGVSLVALLRRR